MDIKNTRDFAKIINLCTKKCIKKIKITTKDESIELELSDAAFNHTPRKKRRSAEVDSSEAVSTPEYSDMDLLLWSAQQIPDGPQG